MLTNEMKKLMWHRAGVYYEYMNIKVYKTNIKDYFNRLSQVMPMYLYKYFFPISM